MIHFHVREYMGRVWIEITAKGEQHCGILSGVAAILPGHPVMYSKQTKTLSLQIGEAETLCHSQQISQAKSSTLEVTQEGQ